MKLKLLLIINSAAVMMMDMVSNGMACSSVSLFTLRGLMSAVMPMTTPILQMYEPNTLPIDKSIAPLLAAK